MRLVPKSIISNYNLPQGKQNLGLQNYPLVQLFFILEQILKKELILAVAVIVKVTF